MRSNFLVITLWIVLLKTCHFRVQHNLQSKVSNSIRSLSNEKYPLHRQFSFIAILVDSKSKQPFCTGSLIEELIVLTAAQCIEIIDFSGTRIQRQLRSFFVGLACDNPKNHCRKHKIDYALIHARHVSYKNANDLVLLKLRKDFFEKGDIEPKPKEPFPSWSQVDLRTCSSLGYGYPNKRDLIRIPKNQHKILAKAPKGSLRSIKVSMSHSQGVCHPNSFLEQTKFLCSDQQSKRFMVFFLADRGGPLLCRCKNNDDHGIVGQFTWQAFIGSSQQSPPASFTNLSFHLQWIRKNIPFLKALKDRDSLIKYIEYPPAGHIPKFDQD